MLLAVLATATALLVGGRASGAPRRLRRWLYVTAAVVAARVVVTGLILTGGWVLAESRLLVQAVLPAASRCGGAPRSQRGSARPWSCCPAGGVVAAAAFLHRAAELSPDAAGRVERTLAAVRAEFDAGAADAAAELLTTVENAGMSELQQAQVDLLRGQIAFPREDDDNGPRFMPRAAHRLSTVDPTGRATVGRASGVMDMVLAAARSSAPASRSPDIIDALTTLVTEGLRAAVPLIRDVLDGSEGPMWTRRPALAIMLTGELWDLRTHATISEWLMKNGRESGSPFVLRLGLGAAAANAALRGELGRAMAAIAEEEAIADATGGPPIR